MSLLIASAPHADTFGYSMPPPGLLRLGGAAERAGHELMLEDLAFALASGELPGDDGLAAACAERLLARRPTRLGLSVMGATLPIALAIAERVRERAPELPIWVGGPGTTGTDVALLERFPQIDLVVRGEGEQTLLELLGRDDAAGFAGVAGLTWRDARGRVQREADRAPQPMEHVAPYAWHLLPPIAAYKALTGEDEGLVPLDSGRGCAYDCSFCTIGRFWSRRSRPLPAARLAEEIASLTAIPGARNAYLCHDLFGADRRHALELCRELETRDARVPWEVRARLDHLDDELIDAMARAGCYRVLVGVESADGAVRNANHKRMDSELAVVERLGRLGDAGIVPILSLILGLPGEDDAALERTLELCVRACMRTGVQLSLHLVNPQPGCGLGEEHAVESRRVEGIPPDMALGAGDTEPERALIAAHPDLFSTWSLLTGLPGGEPHLRYLHRLAEVFAPLAMRYPYSYALLARRRGLDARGLFDALEADGRSFEAACALERDALIDDCLAWEQGKARAAAAYCPTDAPTQAPRSRGRVLRLGVDLAELTRALGDAGPLDDLPAASSPYVLLADDQGVCTLRVGVDVADALEQLDGSTLDELEQRRPGVTRLYELLAARELVDLPGFLPRAHPDQTGSTLPAAPQAPSAQTP